MLMTCPECSRTISDQASGCPGCGLPSPLLVTQENYKRALANRPKSGGAGKKILKGAAVAIGVAILGALIIAGSDSGKKS